MDLRLFFYKIVHTYIEFYWFLHKKYKSQADRRRKMFTKSIQNKNRWKNKQKSKKGRLTHQIGEEEAEDGTVAATKSTDLEAKK